MLIHRLIGSYILIVVVDFFLFRAMDLLSHVEGIDRVTYFLTSTATPICCIIVAILATLYFGGEIHSFIKGRKK